MKIYLSKSVNIISLVISALICAVGLIISFLDEIFYGIWFALVGLIGLIFSIQNIRNRNVIIEVLEDKIRIPIKKELVDIYWDEIIKAETKIASFPSDGTDSYILLFLKDKKEPLKIALPDLTIGEEELVTIINNKAHYK